MYSIQSNNGTNNSSSGDGGNGINSEESDDESSSSSPSANTKIETDLEEFRKKWQNELVITSENTITTDNKQKTTEELIEENDEEKARNFFIQGTEQEKLGNVYDAMRLYRRAVQLVPDIEFKIYEKVKNKQKIMTKIEQNDNNDNKIKENPEAMDNEENLDGIDLMLRFKAALQKNCVMFEKSMDKSVITSGAHFVDLPTEIILYILRWVVSSDLDMRSLEACATVCKGLYVCSRDSEIWHQACIKVWGVNVGTLKSESYLTWRHMFLERTRLLYNGCYISKTNYLRYGENSFQDQFYRPVQLVEYFRYFRFFPDGQVLMMTSADEPSLSVNKLTKNKTNLLRNDIMKGHYRLHNDVVIIVLKRMKQHKNEFSNRANIKRGSNIYEAESNIHTFYVELNIVSTSKRRFCQLQWKRYSIIQIKNKTEIQTDFELSTSKYPALWFSRVRSYHAEAEQPLQY